jgi:hypothetical protein
VFLTFSKRIYNPWRSPAGPVCAPSHRRKAWVGEYAGKLFQNIRTSGVGFGGEVVDPIGLVESIGIGESIGVMKDWILIPFSTPGSNSLLSEMII